MGRQSFIRSLRQRIRNIGTAAITLDKRCQPKGRMERRSIAIATDCPTREAALAGHANVEAPKLVRWPYRARGKGPAFYAAQRAERMAASV